MADGQMRRLSTRSIVIATGAKPFVPPIPGLAELGCVTSDTVWNLRELPRRLVVLGGGPIGCELAQTFARLGSQVTQVEMAPRLLLREDPEVSELVMQRFAADGMKVAVNHAAQRFLLENGEKILIAEHAGQEVRIPFDEVLVALGRAANLNGYGLEELGIPVAQNHRNQRIPANPLPQHLRRRRCRRALPVHPHRRPSGLVRGGQCAVRPVPEIQGRLHGDSVGDLYRAGSRPRRPQRT